MARFEGMLRPRQRRRTERLIRLRNLWIDAQWWAIGALGLAALILGFVGFRDYEAAVGGSTAFWDVFYLDLQLFVLNSGAVEASSAIPLSLQIARLLAPAVAGVAVIRAFAPLFRDQFQLLRFRFSRDHIVVCGLGNKGVLLSRSLRERGHRVVAIERDQGNDRIAFCRSAGVAVLIGDATDPSTLRKAGVGRAGCIVAVCADDGVNAEVAVAAHGVAATRTAPLICLVHLTDPQLCSLVRARFLATPDPTPFRLDFFNTFERGAQALLLRHPAFADEDLSESSAPHMLVVGLGRMGSSLVVQAARNWRAGTHPSDRKLCITAVDRIAESKVRSVLLRHPEVADICQVTPLSLDAQSAEFERGDFANGEDSGPITAAYVCFDDDARSMEAALVLHNRLRGRRVPIVMRSVTAAGLPALLEQRSGDGFEDLHAFALLDHTCDPDLVLRGTDEVIARAIHDVYLAHREATGWRYGPELDEERRTDPALALWDELSEDLRDSNRDQARHTAIKLEAAGCELEELTGWLDEPFSFTDEEVELLAEMEHERWVVDRIRNRWVLGAKDLHRKRSPHLVSWADLPEDIREYDRVFVRGLPMILAKIGYRIVRVV